MADRIFTGVSSENIDTFFAHMCMSDSLLPHTHTRLSPITFQNFMTRNNIMCLNQRQVYDAACAEWRFRIKSLSEDVLKAAHPSVNYDICEQPHFGWSPLIDLLNRVLEVENICKGNTSEIRYHQMHYLAHVSYIADVTKFSDDDNDLYFRTMFRDCISPILYTFLIPAAPIWSPIMMFTDMNFSEAITKMVTNVCNFISTHCGRTSNAQEIDVTRLGAIKQTLHEALELVSKNKYDVDVWKSGLGILLTRLMIIRADLKACEMHDVMERDGCKSIRRFRQIHRMKLMYDKQQLDDPEIAIDMLLDAYAAVGNDLKSYCVGEGGEKELKEKCE